MGISFDIVYHRLVMKEDIPKLSAADKERISDAIEDKLVVSPEIFGKSLRQQLRGYRKLRVGNYRIVFRIEKNTVKIFHIGHRSVVYKQAQSRIL